MASDHHRHDVFGDFAFSEAFLGDGDEYVRCVKCGYGGCDARVAGCGCTLHARCIPLATHGPLTACPVCHKPTQSLVLFAMSFREIDEAVRSSTSLPKKNHRKRKPTDSVTDTFNERRTGRWTPEEMNLCDKLMKFFASGELPVADSVKLNEFLGNMLKSKQSRLTKKMKNAKLSTKLFQRTSGYLSNNDAREFSEAEETFFHSILDLQERAEVKFHMQKEWREQFSRVCNTIEQPLDSESWLHSVEEMDRRQSKARDAARMTRRKLMMGVALHADSRHQEAGVFIEKTAVEQKVVAFNETDDFEAEVLNALADTKSLAPALDTAEQSSLLHSAPFLAKVTGYLQRHNVCFEHVDLWVPSFVSTDGLENDGMTCRLCYAGNSTTEKLFDGTVRSLTPDEQFNLYSFGDYSQKFSFSVGCGLPGRVYDSGRPSWQRNVHAAPDHHFERCGGAEQWGVKTVLGIPIASPNVGRIVVVLYSLFDRPKDEDLVTRLSDEFTRLMPSPKWKLVVDIGEIEETAVTGSAANTVSSAAAESSVDVKQDPSDHANVARSSTSEPDSRSEEVVTLLGKYMPSDPASPLAHIVPGFMSLRLLLLRSSRTHEEEELIKTMLDSYSSYTSGGRDGSDIAVMLARDFLFLNQQNSGTTTSTQQQPLSLSQDAARPSQNFLDPNIQVAPSAAPDARTDTSAGNLSLFGLPSIRFSPENSPALTPIPAPESIETLSIVSN